MKLALTELRNSAGISQTALAKAIGKSVRTIKMWEAGESYPNAEALWDMSVVLNTDPNTLLGWYDTHPREDAPPLAADEADVINGYRSCTPEWKRHVRMDVEAAAGASLKSAECPAPIEIDAREAV